MSLIKKLKEAFPGKYEERAVYIAFKIGRKATIYVDHHSPHIAKIRTTCFKYFPNGSLIDEYVKRNNLPTFDVSSHPDVHVDIAHVEQIIAIIKK